MADTGKLFRLKIISPDRIFYDADVEMVELRTTEGEMGVLKEHIPLTAILVPGVLNIKGSAEGDRQAAMHSGFVEIMQDHVTILAESCEWPEEIDLNRAKEAQIRAEGYIASRIKTLLDGKIAYATHTKEERDSIGATEEDFECAVDIVRALRGVMVAFVVRKTDKGGIRASLRSVGPDVAAVAKKLGGGGHVLAAGCSPETKDINEAVKMITDELVKLF